MEQDMTQGKPLSIILKFTLPLLVGNIFQQFYNMADTIIVGRFVGANALAAVGSTGTVMFLIIGFAQGITAGFTILTSQRYGAKDEKAVRASVANGILLSVLVTILITVVGLSTMKPLLLLMNTPEDIFDGAYGYIMIICGGIFTQVLYNLVASILRALGNSRTPLYFLILAAGLNIVLDLVFIIVFHFGAPGAAWATVISQGVSGVLCLIYIRKCVPELRMEREDWRFDPGIAGKQIRVGIPMGLQYSITAIGTMMVQSSLNMLGSGAVAAFTAGSKIDNVFTQAFVALGTTMSTYNAQNIGARQLERVRKGFRSADVIGCIYAVAVGFILFFAGKYFAYLFISDNAETVIPMVDIYLQCEGMFMIPLYVVNCYRNGFQGMGYGLLPMLSGVAELIGRGVMAVVAAHEKSYRMACMASPFAWIVATALLFVLYFYVMKDMKKKLCL